MSTAAVSTGTIRTRIPARLDLAAEGRQLEDVAKPLTAAAETQAEAGAQQEHPVRRLRPGLGRSLSQTSAIASTAVPADSVGHELASIQRVLAERGPLPRAEIQRLAGARCWGPGVFRRAMAEAVGNGTVRQVGRDSYAAGPR